MRIGPWSLVTLTSPQMIDATTDHKSTTKMEGSLKIHIFQALAVVMRTGNTIQRSHGTDNRFHSVPKPRILSSRKMIGWKLKNIRSASLKTVPRVLSEHHALTVQTARPGRPHWSFLGDLRRAGAVVAAYGECVPSFLKRPVVTPDHPGQARQRRP